MTSDAKRTCPLSNDLQNFKHSFLLNKHAKLGIVAEWLQHALEVLRKEQGHYRTEYTIKQK